MKKIVYGVAVLVMASCYLAINSEAKDDTVAALLPSLSETESGALSNFSVDSSLNAEIQQTGAAISVAAKKLNQQSNASKVQIAHGGVTYGDDWNESGGYNSSVSDDGNSDADSNDDNQNNSDHNPSQRGTDKGNDDVNANAADHNANQDGPAHGTLDWGCGGICN